MPPAGKWIQDIRAETPLSEAARRVLEVRLLDVAELLPQARKPKNPKLVHAVRVASRRAAAALKTFEGLLPKRRSAWFKKQLRKLRRAAGAVRDQDVFLKRHRHLPEESPDEIWQRLLDEVGRRRVKDERPIRDISRRLLQKSFARRAGKLVKKLKWRVRPGNEPEPTFHQAACGRLRKVSAVVLSRRPESLVEFDDLHRLRIDVKRLRYVMEIFSSAFVPAFRTDLYSQVERAQELLGDLNDHVTAKSRLQARLAEEKEPDVCKRLRELIDREVQARDQGRQDFFAWWTDERIAQLKSAFDSFLAQTPCCVA